MQPPWSPHTGCKDSHSSGLEVISDSSLNALLMYHLLLDPRKLAERRKHNLLSQQAGEGTTKEWWRTKSAFCFHVESWRPWKNALGSSTVLKQILEHEESPDHALLGLKGRSIKTHSKYQVKKKTTKKTQKPTNHNKTPREKKEKKMELRPYFELEQCP